MVLGGMPRTRFILLMIFFSACSGLGPAEFLAPNSLDPGSSSVSGAVESEDTQEDLEESAGSTMTGAGPGGLSETGPAATTPGADSVETTVFDVSIGGQDHQIAMTGNTISIDNVFYAIPEDYIDQNRDVIALDVEQVLSGNTPLGWSAADVSGEQEEALPINRGDLGEPITVAQLPVSLPKDDEDIVAPAAAGDEQTTDSVALPVTQGDGWSDEEDRQDISVDAEKDSGDKDTDFELEQSAIPTPERAGADSLNPVSQIYLVPAELLDPCQESADDLPKIFRQIRTNLPEEQDCFDEDVAVVPLACVSKTGSPTGACSWQVLVRETAIKTADPSDGNVIHVQSNKPYVIPADPVPQPAPAITPPIKTMTTPQPLPLPTSPINTNKSPQTQMAY